MVPYPAGGLSDVIARKVNTALGKSLGQPVIVDNLGGASGSIAAQKTLNTPADGHLLFQGSPNELIFAPLALAAVKYKPEDFRQVHRIAMDRWPSWRGPTCPRTRRRTGRAGAAKLAKEGKGLSYASVGIGSFYHLLGGS
jgi:tripartite-type tricarboxylate transporter receptor subunit TctC